MAAFCATALCVGPAHAAEATPCPQTDTGITLPKGFCATVFADNIGHARQMAVAGDGTVFVNTWSGVYYNNDTPPEGGFLVALKDTKGTGKADHVERFGQTFAQGGKGGTGIYIYKDWVYAELNDKIVRYALKDGEITPTGEPEVDPQRHADHRRSPDASVHHRQGRQPVRLHGLGDEHVRGEEPHARLEGT